TLGAHASGEPEEVGDAERLARQLVHSTARFIRRGRRDHGAFEARARGDASVLARHAPLAFRGRNADPTLGVVDVAATKPGRARPGGEARGEAAGLAGRAGRVSGERTRRKRPSARDAREELHAPREIAEEVRRAPEGQRVERGLRVALLAEQMK